MRLLAAASALVVVAAPLVARADDNAEANRHFQLGVELYNEGKYGEALIEFERAYQIAPHPLVLYNLAGTHRELSEYDEAIQHYERFLAEGEGKVRPEVLEQGKRELAELKARVGTIVLSASRDGAEVRVDGRVVGTTPLARPLVLPPGRHTIVVGLPGGPPETRVVSLASGDQETLSVEIAAPADEPDPSEPIYIQPLPRVRRFAVSLSAASNSLEIADTGTALVGAAVKLLPRLSLGVDVAVVAWAVVPSLRFRLLGDEQLGLHVLAAVPLAFADGDESEVFVAGAAGLGLRYFPTESLALRIEAMASFAGGDHGTTVPVFAGVELWF